MNSISAEVEDAVLVERSRTGDRHAFREIVARYQSLVCALAYSATGSRCRSEDLAQETFVTAWTQLAHLREPNRLRGWLCGIARNVIHGDIRRLSRQPAHDAVSLDDVHHVPSSEPAPTAQAVTNEEMALLWRAVGTLPETYREPLILYYREHQSAERVAAALELTPDAAMQRISRGRRLLQERMVAFVEDTLERTNPGPGFTLSVEAALPVVLVTSMPVIAASTPVGTVKGGAVAAVLSWLAPLGGLFAAIGVSWLDIVQAPSLRERRYVARWILALWVLAASFVFTLIVVHGWAHRSGWSKLDDWHATAPAIAVWFGYTILTVTLIVGMLRGRTALRRALAAEAAGLATSPAVSPVPSAAHRVGSVVGFLVGVYWVPLWLAWQSQDHGVAWLIVAAVVALAAIPYWLLRHRVGRPDDPRTGGWYVALSAALCLALINWRLDVWLAPWWDGDVAAMEKRLPMSVVHALSVLLVAWTALFVRLTRPHTHAPR